MESGHLLEVTLIAQALATAPAARLLRELRVRGTASSSGMDEGRQPRARVATPPGVHCHREWFELIAAPWLSNVRVIHMGENADEELRCTRSGHFIESRCYTYAPGSDTRMALSSW